MTETIRILIVDDHAVVRSGLRGLIDIEPGMEVVGEAGDGIEGVSKALSLCPDVILMDLVMPRQGGIKSIVNIRAENPDARILVITSFAEDDQVFPAIKAGALGYLLKDSSPDDLLQAIRQIHRGEPTLHPTIAHRLICELDQSSDLPLTESPLTGREVDVVQLIARGLTNREIAETLCISERTVRTHIGSILAKLHLANRTQAALYALREGLARLE
jgi:NarL family two-component system response regulator LiaR